VASVLVHLATGPENPTRAALALLVARTAADEGHDVSVFFAGDAVQLLRPETASATQGIGTGSLDEHLAALREGEVALFASGMSSKARALDLASIDGVEPAQPQKLVELAAAADTTLTY
jgi:predicted peroxiredoxin